MSYSYAWQPYRLLHRRNHVGKRTVLYVETHLSLDTIYQVHKLKCLAVRVIIGGTTGMRHVRTIRTLEFGTVAFAII